MEIQERKAAASTRQLKSGVLTAAAVWLSVALVPYAAYAGQVYKITDANGNVTYSDRAQDAGDVEALKVPKTQGVTGARNGASARCKRIWLRHACGGRPVVSVKSRAA